MKTLNEFLVFLNDYEMGVIERCLKNKRRAEKDDPDELAHTIFSRISS